MEELDRSKVHVKVQAKPQPEQNIASVFVAGDSRVADGAEENGIDVVTQVKKCVVGERLLCL
jgi:hypothetical protein